MTRLNEILESFEFRIISVGMLISIVLGWVFKLPNKILSAIITKVATDGNLEIKNSVVHYAITSTAPAASFIFNWEVAGLTMLTFLAFYIILKNKTFPIRIITTIRYPKERGKPRQNEK